MTPVRASYRDCSRKVFLTYASRPFEFGIDGHVLNQVERGARQLFLAGIALPEAIRFAASLPGGTYTARSAVGEFEVCLRILWNYVGRAISTGWEWFPVDRFYSHDEHILRSVHDYTLHHAAAALTNPLLTPGMLDLLDLRIVTDAKGRHLLDDAAWAVTPPSGPYDPTIGDAGMVNTRLSLAVLTQQQKMLLKTAVDAHASGVGTQQALFNFEASAVDLTQLHLFRIPDFSGFTDGYTGDDLRVLHEQEDRLMREWAGGFTALRGAPDWRVVMMKGIDHGMIHKVRNLRGYDFRFGLSQFVARANGTLDMLSPGSWPVHSGAEWLDLFR